MKLIDALTLVQKAAASGAAPVVAFLACGFTPLHLQTFLAAHLQLRFPDRRVQIEVGLFDDLVGSVERIVDVAPEVAAVVIEWGDIDPRLSIRKLGGWRPADLPDIVRTARQRLDRLLQSLERAAGRCALAVSLPSLPLPPAAHAARWQASSFELALRETVCGFASAVARLPMVRLLGAQELDKRSPPAARFDVRMELSAGHPYTTTHADAVAELLSLLLRAPLPRKGLITDLDGTLWKGIVGEDGIAALAWNLDGHAQVHGLYQQVLRALADQGVLLAIASKNDPALVEEALKRPDLGLGASQIFPIEAHWQPKSASVGRILKAWNIGADGAVFVDDSPMELAEVKAAFPEIEALLFRGEDAQACYALLEQLRELFGKESVRAEDALRLQSIRGAAAAAERGGEGASADSFLEQASAALELAYQKQPLDPRALELVNKTNQFNLNGQRQTEAAWSAGLDAPEAFLQVASYRDKFGPLGKIAVLRGRHAPGRRLLIDTWVLSCRAFARRIEHCCLASLFTRFNVDELVFDYAPTERNGPVHELFASLLGYAPTPGLCLSRRSFLERCPPLYHDVSESA